MVTGIDGDWWLKLMMGNTAWLMIDKHLTNGELMVNECINMANWKIVHWWLMRFIHD